MKTCVGGDNFVKYDTIKVKGRNRDIYIKKTSKSNNPIKYIIHQGNMITYKQFCKNVKLVKGGTIESYDLTNATVQKLLDLIKPDEKPYLTIFLSDTIKLENGLNKLSSNNLHTETLYEHFKNETTKTKSIKSSYEDYYNSKKNNKSDNMPEKIFANDIKKITLTVVNDEIP